MGRQIIKQPDGLYSVWSTIVDDFIYEDMTLEGYIEERRASAAARVEEEIREIAIRLDKGEKPYYQFTMTYERACALRDELKAANGT